MSKKFNRDIVVTLITNGINIFAGIAISILVARSLGVELKGIYTVSLSLVNFFLYFGNFGITNATSYFTAKGKLRKTTIVSNTTILALYSSIIVLTIGVLIIWALSKTLLSQMPILYIFIPLISLPFNILNNYLKNVILGENNIKLYNFISYFRQLSELLLIIILLFGFGFSIGGALLSYTISSIISAIVISLLVYRSINFQQSAINLKYIREIIRYGYKAYLVNIFSYVNLFSDIFLVYYFLGPFSTGIYSVASNFVIQLSFVPTTINLLLAPHIASNENKNTRKILIKKSLIFITLFLLFIFPVVFLYGKQIIVLLFGKQFISSIVPLRILLFGMIPLSIWKVFSGHLFGAGKPGRNVLSSSLSAIANILLNILLIPRYGVVGAAISSVISYTVMFIISTFQLWHYK